MSSSTISMQQKKSLAREVLLGAPIVVVAWVLILRLFLGEWSFLFPLMILSFSVLMAVALSLPGPLGQFAYQFWKGLIRVIDWLVTRVVCILIYYLLLTPIAWILQLRGSLYVKTGREPEEVSYWRKRKSRLPPRRGYLKQF